ncbi:NAD(+) synthase [Candidatus Roizmanbacteria bacterium]|nr:NAD(+) synthase [Candidatus Roizmanbacteria bacterium]
MNSLITKIKPENETQKIVSFLRSILKKSGFNKLIIGLSGGIDSTTSLYLARKVLPSKNIFIAYLYYFQPKTTLIQKICSALKIPAQNQYFISIKKPVDEFKKLLSINNQPRQTWLAQLTINNVRLGNIMARIRMIMLFDLAKKHSALVCGTENKSEHYLGYFTRFGDAASDIEPIQHLYKTQVYQLAKYLKVPQEVIEAKPTAGLWSGQTDEGEFGFSYQEADQVLYLYFEKKKSVVDIEKLGYKNSKKIIDFVNKNQFKHQTPYLLLP